MSTFIPHFEGADVLILAFAGARGLGTAATINRRFRCLVSSDAHDEALWAPAAGEFIESFSGLIGAGAENCDDNDDVSRAYGGFRELLKFRLTGGRHQGWGTTCAT